jgi:hypothetical protein
MSETNESVDKKAENWDRFLEIYAEFKELWYKADSNSTFINSMQFLNRHLIELVDSQ